MSLTLGRGGAALDGRFYSPRRVEPPTRQRLRRRRSALIAIVLIAIGAGALALERHRYRPSNTDWIELTRGTVAGVGWRLDAAEQDGQLCLSVDSLKGPGDAQHSFAGACGFLDNPNGAAYYYASGLGPAGFAVDYGPLPAKATQVRVATQRVIGTHPLPEVHGLARGRYWIWFTPPEGVPPVDGKPVEAQPLDSHGHPVAYERF